MALFDDSCQKAAIYPSNLIETCLYQYQLEDYQRRFAEREACLCFPQESTIADWGIHCLKCEAPGDSFSHKLLNSRQEVRHHLRNTDWTLRKDPATQFMFLHAKHARERLNTTTTMLQEVLSHYQVAPAVVDQLLSYGRRKSEQEFSACAFHQEVNISPKLPRVFDATTGRSGRRLQLCYTLRAIEGSSDSMRQTSTYHSFDVVSGQTFWLVVKANSIIRDRIQQVTSGPSGGKACSFATPAESLNSALACHRVMSYWANENWRSYISGLEAKVHKLTKPAFAFEGRKPRRGTTPIVNGHAAIDPQQINLPRTNKLQRAGTWLSSTLSRRSTTQSAQATVALSTLGNTIEEPQQEDTEFTIDDMQEIEAIEEKLNTTLLVLKTNSDTLRQLKDFYVTVDRFDGWPFGIASACKESIVQFETHVSNIVYDLKMQQARLGTLLKLLADRKSLFYAIIEHQNVETNKELASRAQRSQEHMEKMTDYMSTLAEKTQQETVSMRIITLVTLFFLPGTFISTLMSTDIIQFEYSTTDGFEKQYSGKALKFFFTITGPLMIATFVVWYLLYWWVKNRQQRLRFKQHMQTMTGKASTLLSA